MEFFKTGDGRIHGARIAGAFYTASALAGCVVDGFDRMCAVRIAFALSWWLAGHV